MIENIKEKIEDKIIDCINSGVSGRLIIFRPQKSFFSENLVVERRGEYKEKEMFFQINSIVVPSEKSVFEKEFEKNSFKADKNFYLVFASFDEIKQKLGEYVYLIPSLQFEDLADQDKNSLKFEAPIDFKIKSKYSKFTVKNESLGSLIFEAFERGKLNFEEIQITQEKKPINLNRLKIFLAEARRNTFASGKGALENPRLLNSKQFEFQKGEYLYRDIYFDGREKFIGQEIIYQNSEPIWGMNYLAGRIEKSKLGFLREALSELSDKCRMGQICEYEKRELKYQDNGTGNFENFEGQEQIYLEGKNIYKLSYQGGLITREL